MRRPAAVRRGVSTALAGDRRSPFAPPRACRRRSVAALPVVLAESVEALASVLDGEAHVVGARLAEALQQGGLVRVARMPGPERGCGQLDELGFDERTELQI